MKLKRSYDNRIVTGVLGGIAERFNWNVNILRIIWIIFTLFTFPLGIIIYTLLWIIMPSEKPNEKIPQLKSQTHPLKGSGGIVFKTSSFIWSALFIAGALDLWFRTKDGAGVPQTMADRIVGLLAIWIPLFLVILFAHLAWYHYLKK